MQDDLREKLRAFVQRETGAEVTITSMLPLSGGASRDSWAIEAEVDGSGEKWVMRRDFVTSMNEKALSRSEEFRLMRAAYDNGVKVARVRWLCEDPQVLGLPFFIMDYVEGISIGRKVIQVPELARAREVLPEQLAQQLALIHTIDPTPFDFLTRPADPVKTVIEDTYAILDGLAVNIPAFEFALRWCQENAPRTDRITFLHGDFRVGNLLVDQDGLAAVIDWEFAHIGDPLEEIGYLCMRDWRFGNDVLRMGGLSDRERFIQAYEGFSGYSVNRAAADWWEIMGNIRWGIICLSQAERHLSGRDPSVELASLGRRSAEMQLEAIRLIERA